MKFNFDGIRTADIGLLDADAPDKADALRLDGDPQKGRYLSASIISVFLLGNENPIFPIMPIIRSQSDPTSN